MAQVQFEKSQRLTATEWLDVFRPEYLESFITQGGSTVKFLSGGDRSLEDVAAKLEGATDEGGLRFFSLDASQLTSDGKRPDFHRIEKFLFAITRNIDWRALVRKQVVEELRRRGIFFPPGVDLNDLDRVAQANDRESDDLHRQYQRLVSDVILRDKKMARDFRVAIAALSRAQVIPDEMSPTTEEVFLGWLRGEHIPGSSGPLKKVSIRERINRSNAWFVLISLCEWLRGIGEPGMLVTFDFRAYEDLKLTKAQMAQEQFGRLRDAIHSGASQESLAKLVSEEPATHQGITYSPVAYLQALELLRHLIDGIEQLPGFGLVVLASPRFFEDRQSFGKTRRFIDYNALQTRIGLEVHDVEKQNPSAALVHLEAN